MASKSSGCTFYIIILALLAGGGFLFWGKFDGLLSNGKDFSLEEYCQFLYMTENQRAEIMYEKKIQEHDNGYVIQYPISSDISVFFNKTENLKQDWYMIHFSKRPIYEDFMEDVKKNGQQISDPANTTGTTYKIFEKFIIRDLGFLRPTKKYQVVVDDTNPSK